MSNVLSTLLRTLGGIGLAYAANKCVNPTTTAWEPYRTEIINTAITQVTQEIAGNKSAQ